MIKVWRFNNPDMAEHSWVAVANPDTFSARDLNHGMFCIRPLVPDAARHGANLMGIAGWVEEFTISPFERYTGEAVLVSADDLFFLKVRGINQLWELTYTDLFNALDSFTSLIGEVRRKAVGMETSRGTFVGRGLNYEHPVSVSMFAEPYEPGTDHEQRQRKKAEAAAERYGPDQWGKWS